MLPSNTTHTVFLPNNLRERWLPCFTTKTPKAEQSQDKGEPGNEGSRLPLSLTTLAASTCHIGMLNHKGCQLLDQSNDTV